jgi:G3E family GTPase
MSARPDRVPVTILTGFLGAGKTTLLNRILRERHGLRIAVIENEFGSESVDADILVRDEAEEIVQLDNGCLCCNIRGDLLRALAELANGRAAGRYQFDHVVVETSGMADPGPVAQSLSSDPETAQAYRHECIVTVVDALHGADTLLTRQEARAQVAYADRLVLTKTELAGEAATAAIVQHAIALNPAAQILDASAAQADLAELLLAQSADEPSRARQTPAPALQALHGSDVGALTFVAHRPFDPARLEHFLAATVDICGVDLFRCKGVLWVEGCDTKVVLQGVQLTMRVSAGSPWLSASARRSKIVLIGRELPADELRDSLRRCLVDASADDEATPGVAYVPMASKPRGWLL